MFKEGKRYKIIGGEHRYKVAMILGYEEIPIIIKDYDEEE